MEFDRIEYNLNSRIIFNDTATDTTKYVLLDYPNITDTLAVNVEEGKPEEVGIIDFGTKLEKGSWIVPVTLWANSLANMQQLIQNFKEALNPDLMELDSTYGEATANAGYHPMDWTETVGATSRSFRIYVKSLETPQVAMDSLAGLVRKARVQLKARDPRKYLQTQSSLSGAGTAANAGTYPTPVEITITASGATSTSLEIVNTTTSKTIYVTTAMANNDVLVIDTFLHSAKLNGTETRSMLGAGTDWWLLNPGNNTITINNGTNATIVTRWRSAWPM